MIENNELDSCSGVPWMAILSYTGGISSGDVGSDGANSARSGVNASMSQSLSQKLNHRDPLRMPDKGELVLKNVDMARYGVSSV